MRIGCIYWWLIVNTLVISVAQAQSAVEWQALSFTLDNDLFTLTNGDRHYTNGVHIRLESKPFDEFNRETTPSLLLPLLDPFPLVTDDFDHRTLAYQFGQLMFTPADISISNPQPDDMPYAGMLYMAADLSARNEGYADTVRFMVGIVGPWSQADDTQRHVHQLINSDEPQGWNNQLHNELVFNLMYERRTPFSMGQLERGFNYQWINIQQAELGTINTGAEVSLALLITEIGTPQSHNVQPSVAQNTYLFRTDLSQGYFGLFGITGRLTLRNIFLDGNTFRDSPSVEKELLSAGVFYGIGYSTRKWGISASWVSEGKRFETQDKGLHYGSVTVTYRY